MLSNLVVVSLLAISASVSALVVPRATPPKGWNTAALEPYDTYHARYLALQCSIKHNTQFFDECCHPLLAKEKLSSRPAQCTPKGSAADDLDDQDCDDDDDLPTTPAKSQTKAPAKTTAPPAAKASATKKPAASPSPSPKAKVATPASSSSVNKGGFATFFYQNGNAGACGDFHSDNDLIAAIDADRYGNTGKKSSLCGKKVTLTNTKNGKSVTVTIADACPTCKNSNSIDLSVAAFNKIATPDQGIVPIDWTFV